MIQTIATHQTVAPPLALQKRQIAKAVAVAIASIGFFGVQLQCSSWVVGGVASALSLCTALAERVRPASDWFCRGKMQIASLARQVMTIFLCQAIAASFLTESLQKIQNLIRQGNLRVLAISLLVAPVCEEILFRGFVQERGEDFARICGASRERQSQIGVISQAIPFGLVHIAWGQVTGAFYQGMIFSILAWVGRCLGQLKNRDASLLTPLAFHAALNAGSTAGLLFSAR